MERNENDRSIKEISEVAKKSWQIWLCWKYGSKMTDYKNKEFVIEDLDGRWIAFGLKEDW